MVFSLFRPLLRATGLLATTVFAALCWPPTLAVSAEERWLVQPLDDAFRAQFLSKHSDSIVREYGSQFVVEASAGPALLESGGSGLHIGKMPDTGKILLRGGALDKVNDSISLSSGKSNGVGLQLEDKEKRLFLVEFDGPVLSSWLDRLEQSDVKPLRPVPNYAYLVYGSPADLPGPLVLPELVWAGEFDFDARVHPDLALAADGKRVEEEEIPVVIQWFRMAGDEETFDALGRMAPAKLRPSPIGDHYTARMKLSAGEIREAARLPHVYNIEPEPVYELLGERQALIVSGQSLVKTEIPEKRTFKNLVKKAEKRLKKQKKAGDPERIPSPKPGERYSDFLARKGIDGSGLVVSMLDDGIEQGDTSGEPGTAQPDLLGRIVAALNATGDENGESVGGHGSINAGILIGRPAAGLGEGKDPSLARVDKKGFLLGQGIAPGAKIASLKVFDNQRMFNVGIASFPELVASLAAYSPVVSSNSWGAATQGRYTADAADFDALTRDSDFRTPGDQELLFCFSAGNDARGVLGPVSSIRSPATAKNVVAVGATENTDKTGPDGAGMGVKDANKLSELTVFSSQGPTKDGRHGVTIVAPGSHVYGPASTSPGFSGRSVSGAEGNDRVFPPDDAYQPPGQTDYTWSSGTSHSCPAVASGAALFYQKYDQMFGAPPSAAMIRAALANSAFNITGGMRDEESKDKIHAPNPGVGWGLLCLERLLPDDDLIDRPFVVDQARVFRKTGEVAEYEIRPVSPFVPLKITLSWTDAPALPNARESLVNDLDLRVIHEEEIYYPAPFDRGFSVPDGKPDSVNNIESVFIGAPFGAYRIQVAATRLSGDGVPSVLGRLDQDFALYVTGGIPQASQGALAFDKEAFAPGETLRIAAKDGDLWQESEIAVSIESDSGQSGTIAVLKAAMPGLGLFKGEIPTSVTGAPGTLQVAAGDEVRAFLTDEDDGAGAIVQLEATARIDAEGPVISRLRTGEILRDSAEILFETDERARSQLFLGPNESELSLADQEERFLESHRFQPEGLEADTVYYCFIRAEDVAGNIADSEILAFHTSRTLMTRQFDLESGTEEPFAHSAALGEDDWSIIETPWAHSATHAWFSANTETAKDASLVLPALSAPLPSNSELVFWHTFELEEVFDAAVIEYSIDGETWTDLGHYITEGQYTHMIAGSFSDILAGRKGWSGGQLGSMKRVRADLGFLAGQRPAIRFRLVCDTRNGAYGWLIDDIQIRAQAGSQGALWIDSDVYPAGATIQAVLTDADREFEKTAIIQFSSDSESAPRETVTMSWIGPGQFHGTIDTSAILSSGDGLLGVGHGDEIVVSYFDENNGAGTASTVVQTATADLASPKITASEFPIVSSRAAAFEFELDEPAVATLSLATQGKVVQSIPSGEMVLYMPANFIGLDPNTEYQVSALLTDALGNIGVEPAGSFTTMDEDTLFYDPLEPEPLPGWKTKVYRGVDDWAALEFEHAKSPTHAWFSANGPAVKDLSLFLPPQDIPEGALLEFWHTHQFDFFESSFFDGGVIEISVDDGDRFMDMGTESAFGTGYSGELSDMPTNALRLRKAFVGGMIGPMAPVYVDLSRWAGPQRLMRFRIGTNFIDGEIGWYIDDVRIVVPKQAVPPETETDESWSFYR